MKKEKNLELGIVNSWREVLSTAEDLFKRSKINQIKFLSNKYLKNYDNLANICDSIYLHSTPLRDIFDAIKDDPKYTFSDSKKFELILVTKIWSAEHLLNCLVVIYYEEKN